MRCFGFDFVFYFFLLILDKEFLVVGKMIEGGNRVGLFVRENFLGV